MGDLNFGVNIIPTEDGNFSLGNSTHRWNGAYINNLNASYVASGTLPNSVVPTATSTNLGGIKISSSTGSSQQTYKVALDNSDYAYVGIPWTDEKVTMTKVSTSDNYPILFKEIGATTITTGAYFNDTGLTFNPATNILAGATNSTATFKYFNGTAKSASSATKATQANITSTQYGLAYYTNTSGTFGSLGTGSTAQVLLGGGGSVPTWGQITDAHISGTIPVDKLSSSTISIGAASASLGGSFDITGVVEALSLNKALTYKGTGTSLPNTNLTNGYVFILSTTSGSYSPGVYVYNGSTWDKLGTNVAYKIAQESLSYGNASNTTESINFIKSLSQDGNGKVTVTTANIPLATTSSVGIMKVGSGLSVSDGTVTVTTTSDVPNNLGMTPTTGTAVSFSRSDHVHQLTHLTTTVAITNSTAAAATTEQWYPSNGQYYYDIPHTFVTIDPPTDININILANYQCLLSKLTASTGEAQKVRLISATVPGGAFDLKISLDKTLT